MGEKNIQGILESLREIKGVHGAALIEKFGLVAGEALPGWIDSDAISAMVTLILKASQRATKELEQGSFSRAILENTRGKLLFSEVLGKIIVVVATNEAKLGIINLKLDAAIKALSE
jgi:predicted regulator of Ras-like GTPase activity (Roadblock/LC7/MglB family)